MHDPKNEASIAAALLAAGYDLPPAIVADVARGHGLLAAVLARIAQPRAEAEPATIFRPETPR